MQLILKNKVFTIEDRRKEEGYRLVIHQEKEGVEEHLELDLKGTDAVKLGFFLINRYYY